MFSNGVNATLLLLKFYVFVFIITVLLYTYIVYFNVFFIIWFGLVCYLAYLPQSSWYFCQSSDWQYVIMLQAPEPYLLLRKTISLSCTENTKKRSVHHLNINKLPLYFILPSLYCQIFIL